MLAATFKLDDAVSPELQQRIQEICAAFEARGNANCAAELASQLTKVDEGHRPYLLAELLRRVSAHHRRNGEQLDWSALQAQMPKYSSLIKAVCQADEMALTETHSFMAAGGGDTPHSTPSDRSGALPLGTLVGNYCVREFIGGGAFGDVYCAEHIELQDEVALKVCRAQSGDAEHQEQFRQEARLLAKLNHPHIIRVRDSGILAGQYFIVSDLVRGQSLSAALQAGPLEFRGAARLVAEIADALAHCHSLGLFHRDVKPDNVLLDADDRALLADFGMALTEDSFSLKWQLAGTPCYMSPEQVSGGSASVDGRSDIFSLGVVLYQCLAGTTPYRSQTREELIEEIKRIPAPPLRAIYASIPQALEEICLKCLSKAPEQRYTTAADLSCALRKWLAGNAAPARLPARLGPRVAASVAAALAIGGIIAVLAPAWFRDRGPDGSQAVAATTPTSRLPGHATGEPTLQTAEVHVQRDPKAMELESHLLIEHGQERPIRDLAPLDADDQFVLFYRFDQPVAWHLIQVDPAGDVAIVQQSNDPAREIRLPGQSGQAASFNARDPRGVNLLLLITGELPPESDAASLTAAMTHLTEGISKIPVRWSQLRAGVELKQSAIQIPRDHLADIDDQLPAGLRIRHAMFLQTAE